MNDAQREMTLKEWVNELPVTHLAHVQYLELLQTERFLDCLRGVGVDNWEGYDIACDLMENE